MNNIIHIACLYRYGLVEKHQYIQGVYSSKEQAIKSVIDEEIYRGGKYAGRVLKYVIDTDIGDSDGTSVIYQSELFLKYLGK